MDSGAHVRSNRHDGRICSFSLYQIERKDLAAFELITELIGRLPVLVNLLSLNLQQLSQILNKRNQLISKQFQEVMQMNNANLHVTYSFLYIIAEKAVDKGTEGRWLRSLMERILNNVM